MALKEQRQSLFDAVDLMRGPSRKGNIARIVLVAKLSPSVIVKQDVGGAMSIVTLY